MMVVLPKNILLKKVKKPEKRQFEAVPPIKNIANMPTTILCYLHTHTHKETR